MSNHVARSLDGAYRDYAASGDAMRWKPPAPTATLVSVRDAAHFTGIPVRTIQRWVLNGWVANHGDDGGQRFLVALEQVIELAETRPNGRLPDRHTTVA